MLRGIWRDAAGGAVWGCRVYTRCGIFSNAFGSAGDTSSVACSVGGHKVGEEADLCSCRCGCVPVDLRSQKSRRAVVKLDDDVMERVIAACVEGKLFLRRLVEAGLEEIEEEKEEENKHEKKQKKSKKE
ncbi:uncharacterized protein MONOS_15681 [Monocercomonoides exilis]|uniref:uncharacterized protein n=1 Tax=Monocercomonoides exilis TaxID=2049356 RepID=UPI003559F82A|nr:hypothetical protein MONOS_15681 [Monocercomonoides exilis]|eukprot:MONOS_15681.1-p1 / transcript=MONOS_15681.1 / gene=MONOS_15681 / organism=Monocercomonoides_exilis_PA203 / gene_product=unspecified product / transcript_product=unspecified product / location=Mono_scaffold01308:8196-8634(+) / protein_length=129 / sequence_SO=supercontig / SO=protein_coding / is_pseudo=false